ncbi:SAM-dependent methyltransferase [Parvibaculaceae bacterium PLY_AMNH_Bact1]|nr:SAM-dependent methyltransferase [Parvibaculaceae bacterium PLY_AMNH_Bact1]
MPLDMFMDLALAHPEHGYYRTRDPLGRSGDFTTAPEISQMFGELLGLWSVDIWQKLGAPNSFNLIEFGPGRGTLMADALRAAKLVPAFRDAANVVFLETSPTLRAEQQQRVPDASWIETIDALPDGPCIILANEFFDALPIKQFQKTGKGWQERCVALQAPAGDDTPVFQYSLADTSATPSMLAASVREAPEGSIAEICPVAQIIMEQLRARFDANPAAALIIDYGYNHSTAGDSFQALKNHKFVDPLVEPGEADLTAHVDFEALAKPFSKEALYGPSDQKSFLEALGIHARANALKANANEQQQRDITSAVKRLTDRDAMGSLFKVMAVTSPGLPAPAGL